MTDVMVANFLDYLEDNFTVSHVSSGSQLKIGGECPFCNESRSDLRLYVNPKTGLGFCHHCGSSFNSVTFVAAHLGISKPKASDLLKSEDRFLSSEKPTEEDAKTVWWPVTEDLRTSDVAMEYLKSRNIGEDIIYNFNLLFSPHNTVLPDGGFSNTSNRIIIPIASFDGNYVGWQGRDITGKAKNKYLISPGLEAGSVVFNIGPYIRKLKYAIICEGIFDVFGWWRAGFKSAVATFGKKISVIQVGMLVALNLDVVFIAWDSDANQKKWEFMETYQHRFKNILFVDLNGKDADEVDSKYLATALQNAKPYSWENKVLGGL